MSYSKISLFYYGIFMAAFKFFFGWSGRIGRLSFLIGQITCSLILYACDFFTKDNQASAILALITLVALCVSWSSWVLSIKRFHDLSKLGLFLSIPIIGIAIIAIIMILTGQINELSKLNALPKSEIKASASMIITGICVLFFSIWSFCQIVQMIFFRGNVDANDYGSPPPMIPSWISGVAESSPLIRQSALSGTDKKSANKSSTQGQQQETSKASSTSKPTFGRR
jgi:uncharacterized membrane protein YhaH (DUF805 family)